MRRRLRKMVSSSSSFASGHVATQVGGVSGSRMIQAITVKGWLKRVDERLGSDYRDQIRPARREMCVLRESDCGPRRPMRPSTPALFFSFTPDRRKTIVPAEFHVLRHHTAKLRER